MRDLRDVLIQATNRNPVSPDEAWALLHAWDAMVDAIEAQKAYQCGERDEGVALWEWPDVAPQVAPK